ncbi:MAG: TIGR02757 family protein [Nitrospirae bacterium]|nr:TIGR02757 family protein [Nitrospirota bacterium]
MGLNEGKNEDGNEQNDGGDNTIQRIKDLKTLLDGFYADYDFSLRIPNDPIEFPHRYCDPQDVETAAFIAASFAYGKVTLFKPVIDGILGAMGLHPAAFLHKFDVERDGALFDGLSYRFNKSDDIKAFLLTLHAVLAEKGSLKSAFVGHFDGEVSNMIAGFMAYAGTVDVSAVYGKNLHPEGLRQLFTSPEKGSACKRVNMFLRWMVRNDAPDFGLWPEVPRSALIIPLDTHIARICRCLGLTKRKSNDWKTAIEITEGLKVLDPDDPLKYDFALCHHGISGACKASPETGLCADCAINPGTVT